jgi:hypothetical protein
MARTFPPEDTTISDAIAAHEADPDPHTGYQLRSEKDAVNGYLGVPPEETISTATATITIGKRLIEVTHASPTITLPPLYASGLDVIIFGPATAGAFATIKAGGSDTIDGLGTGGSLFQVEGFNYRVRLVSDGTTWRLAPERGVFQVPAMNIDLTGASGGSPWSFTNAVDGSTATATERSTASSSTTASTGLLLTPANATALFGTNTGAGFSVEPVDAKLTLEDTFAVFAEVTCNTGYSAAMGVGVILGQTVASSPKAGIQHQETGQDVVAKWGATVTQTIAPAAGHTHLGFLWDGDKRSLRALSGSPSGSPFTSWWPLAFLNPGGVNKELNDPGLDESTAADLLAMARILVAASNTTVGETWTVKRIVVVRVLKVGDEA